MRVQAVQAGEMTSQEVIEASYRWNPGWWLDRWWFETLNQQQRWTIEWGLALCMMAAIAGIWFKERK